MRLKIVSEFMCGKKRDEVCQEYGISPPTLYEYVNTFNSDYTALIGFFKTIMEELWANGYTGAAQHLRNNAPRIFQKNIGSLSPNGIEFPFGNVEPQEEQGNQDDVTNALSALDAVTANQKGR